MRWDSQERASPQNGALCWLWSTSPSTILGTVGRKEVPRTCAILGAACVSSPVHPIRSLEGMTDTQRSGDSCTDFAVATGVAGVNVAELSLARMTRSSAFSLAMSLII